jgi:hypothetical protein
MLWLPVSVHHGIGVNSGAEPLAPVFLAYWVQNAVDAPLCRFLPLPLGRNRSTQNRNWVILPMAV